MIDLYTGNTCTSQKTLAVVSVSSTPLTSPSLNESNSSISPPLNESNSSISPPPLPPPIAIQNHHHGSYYHPQYHNPYMPFLSPFAYHNIGLNPRLGLLFTRHPSKPSHPQRSLSLPHHHLQILHLTLVHHHTW